MDETQQHMQQYFKKNMRYDGRKFDQFRDISVELNISKSAEGSARVKIGNTHVIAGVKLEVGTPYPDTPDQGTIMVNAELLAMANPDFEPGPPSMQAVELARVIDRGIRESHFVDFHKLCLVPGEKMWTVIIDIMAVNDDGNLFDAAGLAAVLALKQARLPELVNDKPDYKHLSKGVVPLSKADPVSITVHKIAGEFIADPTLEEEKASDARITVAITAAGKICAMQKGGEEMISLQDLEKMIDLATKKGAEIRKYIK